VEAEIDVAEVQEEVMVEVGEAADDEDEES